MSEPNPGLPAPAGQPQGISPQPGQPPETKPQTPAPNTPPTQAAPPQPAAPAPDVAKIQKERDDAVAYARAMQSERDRLRAAVAGPQPVDQMQARIKAYTENGYSEQDARFFISQIDAAVQPLQQQNAQLHAQIQGTTLVHTAYQKFAGDNPELANDPHIAQTAWNALQNAAMQGDPRYITAEYAEAIAAQEYSLTKKPWKQPNTAPPPPPMPGYTPRPVMMPFGGPGTQFSQVPQPAQAPEDPSVNALADEMAKRWTGGKTLSQLNQK